MLIQYVRHTLRALRKSPGFAATAIATLALGIGANTAVFSVADAVLLRPLPYGAPERLIALWETSPRRPGGRDAVAPANLADYQAARSFEDLAGYTRTSMSLTGAGTPEQLFGEQATWNLFDVLGVSPVLGRAFRPEDDRPGAPDVAILSHALWRIRFHSEPGILGLPITLNGRPFVVVGVMPEWFQPLSQFGSAFAINFFVPAAYPEELLANHGDHEISVVGRLKDGVSIVQARDELKIISEDLGRRFPQFNAGVYAPIAPLSDDLVREVRPSLIVMLWAVALVLLIACANLANLMIVRAIGQRHEVAIRLALGATRGQIAADLAVRGLTLGVLGGVTGLVCGLWTRDALVAMAPASIPRLDHLTLNGRVLAVAAVLSVASGVLAGLTPALSLWRRHAAPTLKSSALSVSGARSVARWRGLLMAAEIGAALVLAVGAGLMVRSLAKLTNVELGFRTDRVLALTVRLPDVRYRDGASRATFFAELERRLHEVPGIESVAYANEFPMRGGWSSGFMLAGDTSRDRTADFQAVSPGYFATLGIPLMRGRLLTAVDSAGAPRVAVVSRAFAEQLPGNDAIGLRFRRGPGMPELTIVGVVGDVRRDGRQSALKPQVYLSAAQSDVYPVRLGAVAVRADVDAETLVPAIRRAVWSIDADQPITNVRTMDDVARGLAAPRRFNMTLLTTVAVLAIGLALVGVYGVVAYAAAQRTREIGIRVALGATRGDVVRLIVASGFGWAVAGVIGGVAVSAVVSRAMASLLFEIAPTDPVTFGGITIAMLAVALAACSIPAVRASSADPVRSLRTD